ncbi:MAG: ribonuclease Z [Candidatus Micrarchaeota archaeon]
MLNITILGSSGSAPTKERNLPSIAVQINGDVLLLDCGEGTQRQMMKHGVSYAKVKAIFISHLHLDHFLGIFGLGETLRLSGRTTPIQIFGPPGTARVLYSFGHRDLFNIHEISKKNCSKTKPIFSLHNHEVFCFLVSHGKRMNAFGFAIKEKDKYRFYEEKAKYFGIHGPLFSKIQKEGKLKINKKTIKLKDVTYLQKGKKITYSGDTMYSKTITNAAKNSDLLIHDCTLDDEKHLLAKEKYHSTPSDGAKCAKKANAKKLLLFHLSGRYSKDSKILLEQAKKIFKNTEVAYDGMKLELK